MTERDNLNNMALRESCGQIGRDGEETLCRMQETPNVAGVIVDRGH